MTLEDYKKSLKVRVLGISEKNFRKKVEKVFKSLTSIHKVSRKAVVSYLRNNAGRGNVPNIRSGNLLNNIASAGYTKESKPKYTKTSTKLIASFTNVWSIDENRDGNHLVTSKDGRNAPYASYLNYSSKFSRYNGYFMKLSETYARTFRNSLESKIKTTFKEGTYRF